MSSATSTIRKPRDPDHVAEMKTRRARQRARVEKLVGRRTMDLLNGWFRVVRISR